MHTISPIKRALTTSSTATSFASLISTITEPSGDGIFSFPARVPWGLHLSFFGAGADDTTFDARLVGWDRIGTDPALTLWVPRALVSFSVTLSTQVGIANAKVIETDRFADTLVVHATVAPQSVFTDLVSAAAATRGTVEIFSPANNLIAWAKVPLNGCEKVQFQFDLTGATNANAVFREILCP
jgi:hypothetical protein